MAVQVLAFFRAILYLLCLAQSTGYVPPTASLHKFEAFRASCCKRPIIHSMERATRRWHTLVKMQAQLYSDSIQASDAETVTVMPRTRRRRWTGESEAITEEVCSTVSRHKLTSNDAKDYPGSSLFCRIARVVCNCALIPRKEVRTLSNQLFF